MLKWKTIQLAGHRIACCRFDKWVLRIGLKVGLFFNVVLLRANLKNGKVEKC
jgi:hypothetical protein